MVSYDNDVSGDAAQTKIYSLLKQYYYDDGVLNDDGTGNGAERVYVSMEIDGDCCEQDGGFLDLGTFMVLELWLIQKYQ